MLLRFANLTAIALLITSSEARSPSYNGLAMTPQMGWNNWNTFFCDVSEDLLVSTAESIVKLGLRDLGYNYIVLDDCWSQMKRADNSSLVPDWDKFPNGMKHVADALHSQKFKYGMYSSAGEYTCAGYPGSLDYEEIDALFFADNGVDYLKYDNCYNKGRSGSPEASFNRYKVMSDALNKTGRPILYSLCNWGEDRTYFWGSSIANSWRMSGDIIAQFDRPDSFCPCDGDEYDCKYPGNHCSIMNILNKAAPMGQNAGYGAWNDLDMLEVGVGSLTDEEEQTHFAMWSIVRSPMLIGADVRNLRPSSYSIYAHAPIIAINQDPAQAIAKRVWRHYVDDKGRYGEGEIQLWVLDLANGDVVVALLNGGAKSRQMVAELEEIFFDAVPQSEELTSAYDVYDLWGGRLSGEDAEAIIKGTKSTDGLLYNTSEKSYEDGLKENDGRLFGTKVGTLQGKALKAIVPTHGTAIFRLRKVLNCE